MTKECKDCKRELDVNEFHYSDKPNGILKSYCKECSYNRVQSHIEQDPVAYRYYMNKYYTENPEKYPGNHITKSLPKQCGIYKISCVLTNDSYIGVSTNIRDRIYKHRKAYGKGKQKNLYKLIKQYGWEAFDVEILELCDPKVRYEKETAWIEYMNPNLNINKNK